MALGDKQLDQDSEKLLALDYIGNHGLIWHEPYLSYYKRLIIRMVTT